MKPYRTLGVARWLLISASALLFLSATPAARADDDTYIALMDLTEVPTLGAPDEVFGAGEDISADTKCPFPGGCAVKTGSVTLGKPAALAGFAEFDNKT